MSPRFQSHQLTAYTDHQKSGRSMDEFVMPEPVQRKKRSREESQMCVAFNKWWHHQHALFNVPEILLFKITNEGLRSPQFGALMKAEGLRKGAPDYMLAVPRSSFKLYTGSNGPFDSYSFPTWSHGLFIEFKRRDGIVSPEQEIFHTHLRDRGYRVEVVYSLNAAIDITTAYLTK